MSDTVFVNGVTLTDAEWFQDVNNPVYGEVVNFKNSTYGAIGNGSTDNSTAWAAAVAAANVQAGAAVSSGLPIATATLYLPPGDFVIGTGATVANCNLRIVGAGKEYTRIRIGSGQYLLTVSGSIYQFELRGVSTTGGSGVVKHTAVGTNVQGMTVIEDNNFHDYTECAIGSLSSDMPYVKIKRNVFYGAVALTSKGVALAGLTDSDGIAENAFLRNKYHVKIGKAGNSAKIFNNDFIRFTDGAGAPALTDIWIVPQATTVNAGQGLLIFGNKFGNENLNVADYRILVADEAAGTDFVTKDHATSVSTGFVNGIRTTANLMACIASFAQGVIYSYTPNVKSVKVDDMYGGSKYPYIIQFDAGVTTSNQRTVDTSCISLTHFDDPYETVTGEYSNNPGLGFVHDPFGLQSGFLSFRQNYETGFDPGFTDLTTTAMNARNLLLSSVTRSNITDSVGGTDAGEFTFTSGVGFFFDGTEFTPAVRNAWVEFELKSGAANSLTELLVDIKTDAALITWRRHVKVPSVWQRFRFPWNPKTAVLQTIQFRAINYSAGVKDRVQVGRIRIYHAAEPMQFMAQVDGLLLKDGITAPGAVTGRAQIYIDTADGDLKIVYADGTVKTIVVDT